MELNRYIQHPELLNRETLYDLRSYVALCPYNQVARLLMLHNLYILHDPTFDEELRQAAFCITDRSVLFNLVEARHYKLVAEDKKIEKPGYDLTDSLITTFLDSIPKEVEAENKPSVADATVDYVAYMLANAGNAEQAESSTESGNATSDIIDDFLVKGGGKITLPEELAVEEDAPHNQVTLENDKDELEESYYTETLAKIYIKQGKYLKALEIIQQLNLNNSKKNTYFADQMRFLEKMIIVSAHD